MSEITKLLHEYMDDPEELFRQVTPLLYEHLHRMADGKMAREKEQLTLQATALVNEAVLRLRNSSSRWENRRHFLGSAAEAMRRILVEHARSRQRQRRGGGDWRSPIDPDSIAVNSATVDMIDLDRALALLQERHPRRADVVKLKYFLGLSIDETAQTLEVSPATVKLDWSFARAWLHRELTGDDFEASRVAR